ncbi:TonB-dependent receptor domain-containing protein [Aeromonas diversa]|uniref:TonB-dependent receptor domain-containing protein n=1 Tax=Aeromonas diversa TaxID=502790 RepID=UPI003463357E
MSKKVLAAALLPAAALAQTPVQTNEVMVVTANRVEQPAASVLAPTLVIDRAEIEARQVQSLPDLLKTLPGIQIASLGGRGHQSSLFVRGTNSNHSLVLINGRQIAAMVAGTPDLSQIPLGLVERIEYIRGPRAAVYGSDAIGGVINIITQTSARQGSETHLTGGAGSHGYGLGQLRSVHALGSRTDGNLMLGYERTDGVDVVAGAQQPDRDGFDTLNGQAGINHAFTDQLSGELNALGWSNLTETDDSYRANDQSKVLARQFDGALTFKNERLNSRFDASYGEHRLKTWWDERGEGTAQAIHTGMTRFAWVNGWQVNENLLLTAGADWLREQMKSDSRSGGKAFNAPDRDNSGLFVVGGYRWQPVLLELSGRTDDNDQYGRHNTWSSAVGLNLDEQHNVRLSYGTAFKAPSFLDLYYPGYENPDLKPEESKNLELGLSGSYSTWDWSANLYRNRVENLIVCQQGYITCIKGNTDAEMEGLELALGLDTGPIHHNLSYDYTRAKDKNAQDLQLLRRAKHKGGWLASVETGPVTWSGEVLYVGQRNDNDFSTWPATLNELGSYTLFNLGSRYAVTERLTLGGRIDNLFDKHYDEAVGYPGTGTEFRVTADYRL